MSCGSSKQMKSFQAILGRMKDKLIQAKMLIEEALALLEENNTPTIQKAPEPSDPEFEILKSILNSDEWPLAVPLSQIADDTLESDKEERAEGIAEILLPPTSGKKFLDFGCGEGHVAKYVSKEASLSIGYDIEQSKKSALPWETIENNFLLTTDFEKVKSEGPYDLILIYDVLDHAQNPNEILSNARSILSDDGAIYLRCHPWCGRHGGHLYRSINKAFVHLVFTEAELKKLGLAPEYTRRVLFPLDTYKQMIQAAGLQASEPEMDHQEVEAFFSENDAIRSRILKSFAITEWQVEKPGFQMSQCFVDYVLKK